jgi:pimeloyl-ACP methyl ester carboxylesterase
MEIRNRLKFGIAAALVFVLVPVLGAAPAGAVDRASPARAIAWHGCPAGSAAAMAGGFVCATVTAPLDYAHLSGPKIKLAIVEHPATGSPTRGVIFVNPGGPGGQGTVQIPQWLGFFPKEMLRDFDIVSWDPRGVGSSTAVQCFPNQRAETAFLGKYVYLPTRRDDEAGYIARWREFGKICEARNRALLAHVSTADSARDLNLLRLDLGQAKLDYLGLSYGTFLGATYTNLFPRHVGRMVLDGNTAPDAVTNGGKPNPAMSLSLRLGENNAVAKVLGAFLRICGRHSTTECAFSAGSLTATSAKWSALLARLRRAPINLGGSPFTYAELLNAASADLDFVQPYTTPVTGGDFPGWSGMAQGLEQLWLARNQNASAARPAATADVMTAPEQFSGAEQAYAIICNDSPSPAASAYAHLQRLVRARGSVIGLPYLWEQDEPCATWPVHGVNTYSGPWNAHTSPILVINNTNDPATSLANAKAMTHELGDARLLAVKGYGHTSFLNPSTCAENYMTAYFLTGAVPPKGTVCSQNLPPFATPVGQP